MYIISVYFNKVNTKDPNATALQTKLKISMSEDSFSLPIHCHE